MMDFLIYDGKVALALLVFYLFYRFLLKKETFHRFNRVVLVGTAALSFILPLCIITIRKPMEMVPPAAEPGLLQELSEMELVPAAQGPWWPVALSILFWAGVVFVLARTLVSILSIVRIISQGEQVCEEDGCKIIVTSRDIDPFSWMKYIVLSRKDWDGDHSPVIAHEKAHIAYGHSVEVLLVDILSALQWFNPAVWMLRSDLQELHEYEADDAVLRSGANIKEYQYLLIRKAVSKSGYSVANSFNHSILKNRITMMSKSKSPLSKGLRALWMLPLVCLWLGLQARTVYVPADKDSEIIPDTGILEESVAAGEGDETMPTFNGGSLEDFARWVQEHLVYPPKSIADNAQGRVLVSFTITETGDVADVKVLRSANEDLDAEAVRIVSQSPKWTPGTKDGKPVSVQYNIPIVFKLNGAQTTPSTIVANVRPDGSIEISGKEIRLNEIAAYIRSLNVQASGAAVQINAAADTPMGVINDLKEALREVGGVKIYYAKPEEIESNVRHISLTFTGNKLTVPIYDVALAGMTPDDVCVAFINADNRIFFESGAHDDEADILRIGKAFLKNHGAKTSFMLRYDKSTSYGAYQKLQALLSQIYREVRDEKAKEIYDRPLTDLSEKEQAEIFSLIPMHIFETDMKG
ncbi:MAG: TonB family protein [Bacteroidales bacterium]|nr:TonB family protein [Bacteroidales bacterium]